MAQTIGFGDLQNQGQQNQDPNQQGQQQTIGQNPQQNQQNATTTPQAGQTGTATGGGAQSGGGGGRPGDQYKPAAFSQQGQGTGFTNIQRLVGANNPSQLQNTVAQNIGQQNQQAMGGIQQSQQMFNQQSQANQANTQANQGVVQNVLANPLQFVNQQNGTAPANPSGQPVAASPTSPNNAQGSQFSQLISGQYNGPTGLANADQVGAQAQAAGQQGQNLATAGGRASILQNLINKPGYSQGQQNLDSLLLGQGNPQALTQARRQALGLQDMLNQASAGAQAQGQEQASNAQQFGQQVQGQLGATTQAMEAGLQQKAQAADQDRSAQYNKMLTDLQTGNITQDEANMLGLTQGENVYNTLQNAGNFLTQSPIKASEQNVASTQDYAKFQALQQLAGANAGAQAQGVFQKFQSPSQAGTIANTPIAQGNAPAFQTALQNTSQQYHSVLDPAAQSLQYAQNISNWQQGNVSQDQVNQFLQANPGYASNPYANFSNPSFRAVVGESLIQQQSPGAVTNGNTRGDWAASNLQTAQNNMNQVQQQLNQQYGTPETINIIPQDQTQVGQTPAIGPRLGNMLQPGQVTDNV